MIPTKSSLLLLFVICCVTVNCLPFNAKYRFVRDTAEEAEEEATESGSGAVSERDDIANSTSASSPSPSNSTSSESKSDDKSDSKDKADAVKEAESNKEKTANAESEKAFGAGQSLTSSEFAANGENKPKEDPKEEPKKEAEDKKEESKDGKSKSNIEKQSEEESDEEPEESESEEAPSDGDDDEESQEENSEENEDAEENEDSNPSDLKMFFISPFERNENEDPSTRQILTYPAKSHGWGHTHQFGPSHIWNSDYPYFAYGYSWGCGHHGYGPHGHVKKSDVKGNSLCRDYVLIPAVGPAPAVLAPNDFENGVARNFVSKDIACSEGDTECTQRQVIGSMAGGSMFGDGMGGLGLGFPGVPGIHTGISGYNMAGGFGDHMGYGGHFAGHHGRVHGGHARVGGYGPAHFIKSDEQGFSSFWNARGEIPRGEDITKSFFGGYGPGRGATFFHGEDILPIHEASDGIGSGHSYGHGSAQWWDKTPSFHSYGLGHGDVVGGHGDAILGGPVRGAWAGVAHGPADIGPVNGPGFGVAGGAGFGGAGFAGAGFAGAGFGGLGGAGYAGLGGVGFGRFGGISGNRFGLDGFAGNGFDGLAGHGFGGYGFGGHGVGLAGHGGIVDGVNGDFVDGGHGGVYGGHGAVVGHGGYGLGDHSGWAFGGHDSECCGDDRIAGHFGLDSDHDITFTHASHGYGGHGLGHHGGLLLGKSKIKHHAAKKSSTAKATTRQDIAMPDEQAMMDVTKQRQLIGSLGASTLFADNVGGMGLGHPGVPQMSSGVAGIPGEYGGSGGYSHGWDGEGPGIHPHGYNNFGYNGGDHDERSEMPQAQPVDENGKIHCQRGIK